MTGLIALRDHLKNNQMAVFFRNNHFSTIIKHDFEVYTLATDVAFTEVDEIIWECMSEISGNNQYCNHQFIPLSYQNNISIENQPEPVLENIPIESFEKNLLNKEMIQKSNNKDEPKANLININEKKRENKGKSVGKKLENQPAEKKIEKKTININNTNNVREINSKNTEDQQDNQKKKSARVEDSINADLNAISIKTKDFDISKKKDRCGCKCVIY